MLLAHQMSGLIHTSIVRFYRRKVMRQEANPDALLTSRNGAGYEDSRSHVTCHREEDYLVAGRRDSRPLLPTDAALETALRRARLQRTIRSSLGTPLSEASAACYG